MATHQQELISLRSHKFTTPGSATYFNAFYCCMLKFFSILATPHSKDATHSAWLEQNMQLFVKDCVPTTGVPIMHLSMLPPLPAMIGELLGSN